MSSGGLATACQHSDRAGIPPDESCRGGAQRCRGGAKQEEEERENKAEEDERAKHMEVDTLGLTEEMDLVTLSMPKNEPGVSAGSSEEDPVAKAAREREEKGHMLVK